MNVKTLILIFFALLFLQIANAQTIYVKNYVVKPNETFTATVYLSNATDIAGIDLNVTFNPNVVKAIDAKLNKSYQCKSGCFGPFVKMANGFVRIVFTDLNGINADNIAIFDLTFKAIGNPGDSTKLVISADLSKVIKDNKAPLPFKANVINGYIKIEGEAERTVTTTIITSSQEYSGSSSSSSPSPITTETVRTTLLPTQTETTTVTTTVTTVIKTTPVAKSTAVETTETTMTATQQHITEEIPITKATPGFETAICILSILTSLILLRKL